MEETLAPNKYSETARPPWEDFIMAQRNRV